jgi:hypothetical protein
MVSKTNAELLVELYPRLFHMAHAGSWPAIQRHGLLSASALLDLFEVGGPRREELETRRRAKSEEILHPVHGRALLRDQIPLSEKKLAGALEDGLTTADWCQILNSRVFFWGPESRLGTLQNADAYRGERQTVLVVDAAKLVARHGGEIELCHMNSGATNPMAFTRGKRTFLPLDVYPLRERLKKYGKKAAVAEVTVRHAVPDIANLVAEVYEIGGEEPKRNLL